MQFLQRSIPKIAAQLPFSLVACAGAGFRGWGLGLVDRENGISQEERFKMAILPVASSSAWERSQIARGRDWGSLISVP